MGAVQWLLRSTFSLVGTVFGAFVAGLLLIFVLSRPRPLIAGYLRLMPQRYREPAHRSLVRLMEQVVAWIKATLIIGAITGVSTGLLFHLIGVQPAPLFGIMAFMGEFVPTLGPIVAAVPALFVALGMLAQNSEVALGPHALFASRLAKTDCDGRVMPALL